MIKILYTVMRSFILLSAFLFLFPFTVQAQQTAADIPLTLGPEACANCHKTSVNAWKKTHHYETFKSLTANPKATEIAGKMGIKRMKSESDCLTCHFTSVTSDGKTKVESGISCESCHGPAKNWMDIHNDFGGKGVKAADETADHKAKRFADAERNGMIRPANIYKVAENCYSCHTVPNEKLVNVGGHAAGSDFDLVAWSQGEVRHNVWYDEHVNKAPTPEHLRMMYIVGKALDLEYSLRGLAKATTADKYFDAMVKREQKALDDLKNINGKINSAELSSAIAAVNSGDIKVNNSAALTAMAGKVGKSTEEFANKNDGSKFSAIDSLLPSPGSYKGSVFQP